MTRDRALKGPDLAWTQETARWGGPGNRVAAAQHSNRGGGGLLTAGFQASAMMSKQICPWSVMLGCSTCTAYDTHCVS